MTYALRIELAGLPLMSNQLLRGHWRVKHAHSMKWKLAVRLACHGKKPQKPLEQAELKLTRCSSMQPDSDGLVSGFKAVIDGLVECGVLLGDKPKHIGFPTFQWAKAKPGKGCVIVEVSELTNKEIK